MIMIGYFKEVLELLKRIEEHLAEIRLCIHEDTYGFRSIITKNFDWGLI
jgi:hypothetical protein